MAPEGPAAHDLNWWWPRRLACGSLTELHTCTHAWTRTHACMSRSTLTDVCVHRNVYMHTCVHRRAHRHTRVQVALVARGRSVRELSCRCEDWPKVKVERPDWGAVVRQRARFPRERQKGHRRCPSAQGLPFPGGRARTVTRVTETRSRFSSGSCSGLGHSFCPSLRFPICKQKR